jgi:vitamin B12/bleomycin/antimicrobial peptide transport system ATP-binding/permease protein
MRIRENAEPIALYDGETLEQTSLKKTYRSIYHNFAELIVVARNLTFFTQTVDYLSMMIGVIFALPKFMFEKMSVGNLMQISSAFSYVANGFSFFMNAYAQLATWLAVVNRLSEFLANIEAADSYKNKNLQIVTTQENQLTIKNLNLISPDGKPLLDGFSACIQSGDRILITGQSGCGKSTLFRTIAGLWPHAEGVVEKPEVRYLFLPQKPYLPLSTLKAALCFPKLPNQFSDDEVKAVLRFIQFEKYSENLHRDEHWAQKLSLGEQQLLGFARVFLLKPEWLFLDEATSSLDEKNEQLLYQLLFEELPKTTVISIGHRSSLRDLHHREICFAGV